MSIFKGFFHLCLFVNDVEVSKDYYKKLGMEELFGIKEAEDQEPWDIYMRISEGQYLELQPVNSPNPHPHPSKAVYHEDQTMWHFSLETENMAETFSALQANGIQIWQDPDKVKELHSPDEAMIGGDGCHIVWLVDPDGNPIEVMEQVGMTKQRQYDHK